MNSPMVWQLTTPKEEILQHCTHSAGRSGMCSAYAYLLLAPESVKLLLGLLLVLLSTLNQQIDELPHILVIEELQKGVLLG